jgi:hypothetical protein
MSEENFLIILGALVMLVGARWLGLAVLFYVGQRRDLYFGHGNEWKRLAQGGSAVIVFGISILTAGLGVYTSFELMLITSGITFFVPFPLVIIIPPIVKHLPPGWLRRLEANRTPEELQRIREHGRAMLESHPTVFKNIISSDDGWESWLMTIT